MKFNVSRLTVAGLSLSKTWDQDLISHRLFATGLSIQFEAIEPAEAADVPDTLGTA